jgi:hypothetical protein
MVFIDNRGLIFYCLISLVAFLWSAFVYQEGIMSLISLIVTVSVLVVSATLLIFLLWEMWRAAKKKTLELR